MWRILVSYPNVNTRAVFLTVVGIRSLGQYTIFGAALLLERLNSEERPPSSSFRSTWSLEATS